MGLTSFMGRGARIPLRALGRGCWRAFGRGYLRAFGRVYLRAFGPTQNTDSKFSHAATRKDYPGYNPSVIASATSRHMS
jgi:hypothetical protein